MGYDWVGFLTDYGRRDGFVAACHGVIAQLAPAARVIDITHDVPLQDIRHGAAVLAQTVPYLPPAVLVGVVDSGVGTSRRGVAIAAGESVLVGPDNGLLRWAADALGGIVEAVSLDATQYHLAQRAGTFDGRDVFAPVAAYLACGTSVAELGSPVDDLVALPNPVIRARSGELASEVLTVDHFGNVQLAARQADLQAARLGGSPVAVEAKGRTANVPLSTTFADVVPGQLVCYVDSAGHIAFAVNQGRAADVLDVRPADPVTITRRS